MATSIEQVCVEHILEQLADRSFLSHSASCFCGASCWKTARFASFGAFATNIFFRSLKQLQILDSIVDQQQSHHIGLRKNNRFGLPFEKWRSQRMTDNRTSSAESWEWTFQFRPWPVSLVLSGSQTYLITALKAFLALIFPHSVGHAFVLWSAQRRAGISLTFGGVQSSWLTFLMGPSTFLSQVDC